jgi:uridine kinase
MTPDRLLAHLADLILQVDHPHPLRIAIDGIDAAGKTTLADGLVPPIEARGRSAVRASLDGFHRPRAERYRQGADSPEGYYADSFDYEALIEVLLQPLGPGGDRRCRLRAFDFHTDTPVHEPIQRLSTDAVLLLDGVFLLRPELRPYWDVAIFLQVDFEVALQRAINRDQHLFGSPQAVEERYQRRYFPAQRRYLQTVQPHQFADVIIKYDDPDDPQIITNK